MANHAGAGICGTFIAIRTMLMGVYGAINAHPAVVTPIRSAAAAVITFGTVNCIGITLTAVETVAIVIFGTVKAHMADTAEIIYTVFTQ